jgi:putative chitinase
MPILDYNLFESKEDFNFSSLGSSDQKDLKKLNQSILLAKMIKRGITDPVAQANIFAQVENESNFVQKAEYTNWSAERLKEVFPHKFGNPKKDSTQKILKNIKDALNKDKIDFVKNNQPEGQYILNRIYGNRMGNNEPDDGYDYRGRGLIQLTGKSNYSNMSKAMDVDFIKYPELVNHPKYAFDVVLNYFLELRDLSVTDLSDFEKVNSAVAYQGFKGSAEKNERIRDASKYEKLLKAGSIVPFSEDQFAGLFSEFYGKEKEAARNLAVKQDSKKEKEQNKKEPKVEWEVKDFVKYDPKEIEEKGIEFFKELDPTKFVSA